ncbi:MAG: hypothetical protein JWR08_724 [Enterovirga sp.]|jgi:hypothetical protein|nr:hypothetical protein [Enterovirga sp.]
MSRLRLITASLAASVLFAPLAEAQTSLFAQPPIGGAAPAPMAPPEASAESAPVRKPKARSKPRGPVPARSLSITNLSGSTLTAFEVAADGRSAKLGKELATSESTTLRLPAFKSCNVALVAVFDRPGEAETYEQDICKDKVVRLTN